MLSVGDIGGKDNKVVCVGRNYVEHIKELENEMPKQMVIFNKPISSISKDLILPKESCRFEGELCFLMGKDLNIKAIGFGLDLTLDKVQNMLKDKGLPWERAKAFKNSVTFSNFCGFDDIDNISFKLYVNEILAQEADVSLMIHKPYDIIKEIDNIQGIDEGDIIMSGTPKGIGYFSVADNFKAHIYEKDEIVLEQTWVVKSSLV